MISDRIDKDIDNDFDFQIDTDRLNSNPIEIDNELESDYMQYTMSTKRDHETSGLSLLRELEDKWNMIEKSKKNTSKNKSEGERTLQTNCQSFTRINYKGLVDEAKRKFYAKVKQIRRGNANDEFECFANQLHKKMEEYIIDAKNQCDNSNNEQRKNASNNHINTNCNSNNNNNNRYNGCNSENDLPRKKTFLKEDSNENKRKKEIPLRFRGNIFSCNNDDNASIENLVYESPNSQNDQEEDEGDQYQYNNQPYSNHNDYGNYNTINDAINIYDNNHSQTSIKQKTKHKDKVSHELMNKMKNVYDEISTPTIPQQQQSFNSELPLSSRNEISLQSLNRNFHEILNSINPSLNDRFEKKEKIITQSQPPALTEVENDKYFTELTKEAGYNPYKKKNLTELSIGNMHDKKFSKKIEENVKLLNEVLLTEKRFKKPHNISNHNLNGVLTSALLTNNSTMSMIENNRLCAKNQFDDTISRIHKANALKINKLLKNSNNNNIK